MHIDRFCVVKWASRTGPADLSPFFNRQYAIAVEFDRIIPGLIVTFFYILCNIIRDLGPIFQGNSGTITEADGISFYNMDFGASLDINGPVIIEFAGTNRRRCVRVGGIGVTGGLETDRLAGCKRCARDQLCRSDQQCCGGKQSC